jgi:hypothetical protein
MMTRREIATMNPEFLIPLVLSVSVLTLSAAQTPKSKSSHFAIRRFRKKAGQFCQPQASLFVVHK